MARRSMTRDTSLRRKMRIKNHFRTLIDRKIWVQTGENGVFPRSLRAYEKLQKEKIASWQQNENSRTAEKTVKKEKQNGCSRGFFRGAVLS